MLLSTENITWIIYGPFYDSWNIYILECHSTYCDRGKVSKFFFLCVGFDADLNLTSN